MGTAIILVFYRNDSKGEKNDYTIEAYWSNDSKKLIVSKFDRRNTRRLLMYKTDVEGISIQEIVSYEELAGDSVVTMADFTFSVLPIRME